MLSAVAHLMCFMEFCLGAGARNIRTWPPENSPVERPRCFGGRSCGRGKPERSVCVNRVVRSATTMSREKRRESPSDALSSPVRRNVTHAATVFAEGRRPARRRSICTSGVPKGSARRGVEPHGRWWPCRRGGPGDLPIGPRAETRRLAALLQPSRRRSGPYSDPGCPRVCPSVF